MISFCRYIVDVSVTKDRKFITINCNSRSTSEVRQCKVLHLFARVMKVIVTNLHANEIPVYFSRYQLIVYNYFVRNYTYQ